jgi:hypothetical protein
VQLIAGPTLILNLVRLAAHTGESDRHEAALERVGERLSGDADLCSVEVHRESVPHLKVLPVTGFESN